MKLSTWPIVVAESESVVGSRDADLQKSHNTYSLIFPEHALIFHLLGLIQTLLSIRFLLAERLTQLTSSRMS